MKLIVERTRVAFGLFRRWVTRIGGEIWSVGIQLFDSSGAEIILDTFDFLFSQREKT